MKFDPNSNRMKTAYTASVMPAIVVIFLFLMDIRDQSVMGVTILFTVLGIVASTVLFKEIATIFSYSIMVGTGFIYLMHDGDAQVEGANKRLSWEDVKEVVYTTYVNMGSSIPWLVFVANDEKDNIGYRLYVLSQRDQKKFLIHCKSLAQSNDIPVNYHLEEENNGAAPNNNPD